MLQMHSAFFSCIAVISTVIIVFQSPAPGGLLQRSIAIIPSANSSLSEINFQTLISQAESMKRRKMNQLSGTAVRLVPGRRIAVRGICISIRSDTIGHPSLSSLARHIVYNLL